MKRIPYVFATPVPLYFENCGLIKTDADRRILNYLFARCSVFEKKVFHDGRIIALSAFSFIYGRRSVARECGVTERQLRTFMNRMEKFALIERIEIPLNKTPAKNLEFWPSNDNQSYSHKKLQYRPSGMTICFKSDQVKKRYNVQETDQVDHTEDYNDNLHNTNDLYSYNNEISGSECEVNSPKKRPSDFSLESSKKRPSERPSESKKSVQVKKRKSLKGKTTRFSVFTWNVAAFSIPNQTIKKKRKYVKRKVNVQKSDQVSDHKLDNRNLSYSKKDHLPLTPSFKDDDDFLLKEKKIEVHKGVKMTKTELENCIKERGSLDAVKLIIQQILDWPGRRYTIADWPSIIKNWSISGRKSSGLTIPKENEKEAAELEELFQYSHGWRCQISFCKIKQIKGLLFTGGDPLSDPIWVYLNDSEFKEKAYKIISEKNMLVM